MNQRVLLIGATSDVAKACAYIYAEKQYNLVLAGRKPDELQILANDIKIRHNVACDYLKIDLMDSNTHAEAINSLPTIPDITLCFAGYLGDHALAINNWAEAERIIQTNYTGVVSLINLVANHYEKQKKGTIAILSSVAGERGRQSNYLYGSAKAGLTAYLSGLRNRLASQGVHVISVIPGFIDTRMTEGLKLPKPLTASPHQVAQAVFKAVKKKKNIVYVLWMWRYIMLIIKAIPEPLFKKLKL
ncbi:SDR family oxidoreductase [Tunicatimonas pelagia]|uniref:SDR family oxidoreductase n=1 Tax=Tunicatimonas pelagia TaxID=931531 RepID=UPI002666E12E|nr:SDR family oxidoreductase [Tunicatimonas pelagia]WKN43502.1 SDR family oxidoreductase [Tunicatimonas pelagia]